MHTTTLLVYVYYARTPTADCRQGCILKAYALLLLIRRQGFLVVCLLLVSHLHWEMREKG